MLYLSFNFLAIEILKREDSILDQPIEYLKGVGPSRGEALRKELGIHRIGDLLWDLPFRYIDKSEITSIHQARSSTEAVQLRGIFKDKRIEGSGFKKRLVATFEDASGEIEVIWFQRHKEIDQWIKTGTPYLIYGKMQDFRGKYNIVHPEMEEAPEGKIISTGLEPVYSSTEKLILKGLDSKGRRKIIKQLFNQLAPYDLPENLPLAITSKLRFKSRFETFRDVHLPANKEILHVARNRIKFEELFFLQLLLLRAKIKRNGASVEV